MSMTDRGNDSRSGVSTTTPAGSPDYRRSASDRSPRPTRSFRDLRETKPSFMTTEFWAMVAGIAALIILYNVTDNPDLTLWRTCLLCTIGASAYMVSRGWAKSGSHDDHWESADRS
jgi:hypothetical protein